MHQCLNAIKNFNCWLKKLMHYCTTLMFDMWPWKWHSDMASEGVSVYGGWLTIDCDQCGKWFRNCFRCVCVTERWNSQHSSRHQTSQLRGESQYSYRQRQSQWPWHQPVCLHLLLLLLVCLLLLLLPLVWLLVLLLLLVWLLLLLLLLVCQIFSWFWQWKNFENWLIFVKVKVFHTNCAVFWPTLYVQDNYVVYSVFYTLGVFTC